MGHADVHSPVVSFIRRESAPRESPELVRACERLRAEMPGIGYQCSSSSQTVTMATLYDMIEHLLWRFSGPITASLLAQGYAPPDERRPMPPAHALAVLWSALLDVGAGGCDLWNALSPSLFLSTHPTVIQQYMPERVAFVLLSIRMVKRLHNQLVLEKRRAKAALARQMHLGEEPAPARQDPAPVAPPTPVATPARQDPVRQPPPVVVVRREAPARAPAPAAAAPEPALGATMRTRGHEEWDTWSTTTLKNGWSTAPAREDQGSFSSWDGGFDDEVDDAGDLDELCRAYVEMFDRRSSL